MISSLEDKSTYGNYRLWGAIGYGCSVFLGGLLTDGSNDASGVEVTTTENRRNFRGVFAVYNAATLVGGCTILYLVYMQIVKKQESTLLEYIQRNINNTSSRSSTPSVVSRSNERNRIDDGHTDNDTVEIELTSMHSHSDNNTDKSVSGSSSVATYDSTGEGNSDVITPIVRLFRENPSIYLFCIIVFLSGVGSGCIEAFLFLRYGVCQQLHQCLNCVVG